MSCSRRISTTLRQQAALGQTKASCLPVTDRNATGAPSFICCLPANFRRDHYHRTSPCARGHVHLPRFGVGLPAPHAVCSTKPLPKGLAARGESKRVANLPTILEVSDLHVEFQIGRASCRERG